MPEIILGIAVIIVLIATIAVLVFFMRKMELSQGQAASQLELRKQAIEHTVAGLKEELGKYQQMLRESKGTMPANSAASRMNSRMLPSPPRSLRKPLSS